MVPATSPSRLREQPSTSRDRLRSSRSRLDLVEDVERRLLAGPRKIATSSAIAVSERSPPDNSDSRLIFLPGGRASTSTPVVSQSSGSVSTSRPAPPGKSTPNTTSNSRATSSYAARNTCSTRSSTSLMTTSRSRRDALRSSSCSERNLCRILQRRELLQRQWVHLAEQRGKRRARPPASASPARLARTAPPRCRSARRRPAGHRPAGRNRPAASLPQGRSPRRPWSRGSRSEAAALLWPPRPCGGPRRVRVSNSALSSRALARTASSSPSVTVRCSSVAARSAAAASQRGSFEPPPAPGT